MLDTRISAIAAPNYDLALLTGVVERHFEELQVWQELSPGMRVVLKPNLLLKRTPEHATTTHPAVVEAVVRVLQAHGITDITLADSPGGPYARPQLEGIYAASGLEAVAKRTGIHLNTATGWQERTGADTVLCHSFNLIDPVCTADYIINLPKLKTHAMTTLSGGVKNLFGCVPGLQKPELHFRFPEKEAFCRMLVDLSLLVRPQLTLVDAVLAMEGNGPSAGAPRLTGMTFAACNPHVLDLGLCHYIALPAAEVFTVAHAVSTGLCPGTADHIIWLGDGIPTPLADFLMPDSKPLSFTGHLPRVLHRPVLWVEKRFLSPRPVVARRECIGCGKCEESCAPKAIVVLPNGKAALDYSKCIRCYCCHEMCPVRAVHIRRAGLLKL